MGRFSQVGEEYLTLRAPVSLRRNGAAMLLFATRSSYLDADERDHPHERHAEDESGKELVHQALTGKGTTLGDAGGRIANQARAWLAGRGLR